MLAQQLPRTPLKVSKISMPTIPIDVGCVLNSYIPVSDLIKFAFSAFSNLENHKILRLSQLLPDDVVSEETFTNRIIQQAVTEFQELFQEDMQAQKYPAKKKQKTSTYTPVEKGGKCQRDVLCIKEKGHRGACKCRTSAGIASSS